MWPWGPHCTLLRRSDVLVAVLVFLAFFLRFTNPDLSGVASSSAFHAAAALCGRQMISNLRNMRVWLKVNLDGNFSCFRTNLLETLDIENQKRD